VKGIRRVKKNKKRNNVSQNPWIIYRREKRANKKLIVRLIQKKHFMWKHEPKEVKNLSRNSRRAS
jgi:hypothetical protein